MKKDINRIKIALCETNKIGKWLVGELDVNSTTVSKSCTNKIHPDLYILQHIAQLLNVSIKDLIIDNSNK